MYRLYIIPGTCSMGIHVLLNKLGQPVELIKRDDVDNYRDKVPTNQVPALEVDGRIYTEGAAIALKLLTDHGHDTLANDPEFRQWLMFNYATLHPAYGKLFSVNALMPEGDAKQSLMAGLAEKAADLWKIVDRQASENLFMFGSEVTVVDYLLAVYVRWGNVFPNVSLPIGANTRRLIERVIELPEFQSALDREGLEYRFPENAGS